MTDLPSPAALLRQHGLRPRRRFGQSFLSDPRVAASIVRAAGISAGDRVVEIGAGLGHLTAPLLAAGASVVAIERDPALVAVLREVFADEPELEVLHADALDVDLGALHGGACPSVVGNLPYSVSAPLLFHLLAHAERTGPWTLMFQREVARRLRAAPGTREYGRVTVLLYPLREVSRVLEVGRGAFVPAPRVDSTVVRCMPRATPLFADLPPGAYRRVVQAAFATRRKTLRNGLRDAGVEGAAALLEAAGLDPQTRGEALAPEQLAALARLLPPQSAK